MSRSKRRGFTLVELLVVIGIIAVLIGILLPSLNNARNAAKTVQCLSNLHQVGLGLIMYMQQNGGKVPPTRFLTADQSPGSVDGIFWANFLSEGKYVKQGNTTASCFMCPNAADERETTYYADPGTRSTNSGYFLMHGTTDPHGTEDPASDIRCSYAVNGTYNDGGVPWWLGDPNNPGPNAKYYAEMLPFEIYFCTNPQDRVQGPIAPKLFPIKNSTRVPMVFDGYFFFQLYPARIKLRHGNQRGAEADRLCNFVFVDGHAESLRGSDLPKDGDNIYYPPAQLNSTETWAVQWSPVR